MRRLRILHIEDDMEDARLLERACQTVRLPADFHGVTDGGEAVRYLEGEGQFQRRNEFPLPDVIVLDLKLPGMSGFDFLKWLRNESAFRQLPVLVFTQSTRSADKERALAEGATGVFVKPADFESVVRLAETLKRELRLRADGH